MTARGEAYVEEVFRVSPGRTVIYKEFSELSSQDQENALRVSTSFKVA